MSRLKFCCQNHANVVPEPEFHMKLSGVTEYKDLHAGMSTPTSTQQKLELYLDTFE